MGQCSTLPADRRTADGNFIYSPVHMRHSKPRSYGHISSNSSTHDQPVEERFDESHTYRSSRRDTSMNRSSFTLSENAKALSLQHGGENNMRQERYTKDIEQDPLSNGQDQMALVPFIEENLPPPPEGALRTRCYRLDLDVPMILASSSDYHGPMPYKPPVHLLPSCKKKSQNWTSPTDGMMSLKVSCSDDSSSDADISPRQVAISTANIFRGITVDNDGVVTSRNVRASRSNRGKQRQHPKQSEKSRQAAKIDKAKDLIEEAINNAGKDSGDDGKSNMVSLVVMGDYNDMKHLVRDGAKRLHDAESLPDEALLSMNRPREHHQFGRNVTNDPFLSPISPSRKRMSPYSPYVQNKSKGINMKSSRFPKSAPPKIRGHPRDKPSSRRHGNNNWEADTSLDEIQCNIDWGSKIDSFWNCGATGKNGSTSTTISPKTTKSSLNTHALSNMPEHLEEEGRNESNVISSRKDDVSMERDAPVENIMPVH